jgi:hypothetical protein
VISLVGEGFSDPYTLALASSAVMDSWTGWTPGPISGAFARTQPVHLTLIRSHALTSDGLPEATGVEAQEGGAADRSPELKIGLNDWPGMPFPRS